MSFRRRVFFLPLMAAACLAAPPAFPQSAGRGETLFRQRCASCHAASPDQTRSAPPLHGVFGRQAGTVGKPSPALKADGRVWDAASLDAYIANPRAAIPRTTMAVRVSGEADRQAIVEYLQSLP